MTILGHILAGKCNQITLKTSRKKQERLWNGYEIDGYMPCMVLIAQVVGNKITKVTTNTHAHTINIRVLRHFFVEIFRCWMVQQAMVQFLPAQVILQESYLCTLLLMDSNGVVHKTEPSTMRTTESFENCTLFSLHPSKHEES